MSVNIHTDVLIREEGILRDEEWAEHVEYYQTEFARINALLASLKLPSHQEPNKGMSFLGPIKHSYIEFNDFIEQVEELSDYRFPHKTKAGSWYEGLFLPQPFPEQLEADPKFEIESIDGPKTIGSSYGLYKECAILAKILGLYDAITGGDFHQLNQLTGFDEVADYTVPGLKIPPKTEGESAFTTVEDACSKFFAAATYSLKYGMAIFIS